MRSIQEKKGMSIGDLYPAVLAVLVIGLILGTGLYILSTLHRSISVDLAGTQVQTNTSAASTLNDSTLSEFYLESVDTVLFTNGSAASTNYTYTTAGVITWGANMIADQSSLVNITFTYNYDASGMPETAVTQTIAGVDDFAAWIAIIVVVIAAAIVVGIVLSSFGRRQNSI